MNQASRRPGLVALALALCAAAAAQELHIGDPVRVDMGPGIAYCNETTIAASKANPLEFVAAWNDYRVPNAVRCGAGVSMDGGETWSEFLLRPPSTHRADVEGDPMTAYDDRTGTLWAGAIVYGTHNGIFVARKDPGRAVFEPSVMAFMGTVDKPWMAAGPGHLDPAGSTRVYIAASSGVLRSEDMGDTWHGPVAIGLGFGFLPRVGPKGELYVAYWDGDDGVMLRRSFDGGASFDPAIRIATRMDPTGGQYPGNFRVFPFQAFAVDSRDGTLYCVYPDTTDQQGNNYNVDLYFTKSTDRGDTWTVPVIANDDLFFFLSMKTLPWPWFGDQFFPWMEVDEEGRIHLVFYDTRRVAQNDGQPVALIDVVYSYSDDGGDSWTEKFLTKSPFESRTATFPGDFLGDYNGLSTAGHRTLPLYLSTSPDGDPNIYTQIIRDGPSTSYCYGIDCPCGNDDPSGGCANETGRGARLDSQGSSGVGADDLVLTVERVPADELGMILMADSRSSLPFDNGRLCIAPDGALFRFPARSAGSGGMLVEGPGIVAHTLAHFPSVGHIEVGSTWHFQAWYRDEAGPCGAAVNLSNALTVTFSP